MKLTKKIFPQKSMLFICDVQTAFQKKIVAMDSVIHGCNYMVYSLKKKN